MKELGIGVGLWGAKASDSLWWWSRWQANLLLVLANV